MVEKSVKNTAEIKIQKVFVLKKSVIAAVVAFFTALILVLSGIYALSRDRKENGMNVFYSSPMNSAVTVTDINTQSIIDGKGVASLKYSAQRKSAAIIMSEDVNYSLYYTDGKIKKQLTAAASNNYVISFDGSAVAYSDSSAELHLYSVETNKNFFIDDAVVCFAISPSGKSVVYVKNEENVNVLYLYVDGKSERIGENYTPLGVSDNSEIIYVLSTDNSLYMLDKNGNMTAKICSDVATDKFCFSADLSSIVFNDGVYTYISVEGKSRIRLVEAVAVPVGEKDYYFDSGNKSTVCEKLYNVFYYSSESEDTGSLYYIDKNFSRTDVAQGVSKYIVTGENSVVYLTSDYDIYLYGSGKTSLLQSDAYDVLATSDGKYIYYTNSASELYCIKNNKRVLIGQNVRRIYMTNGNKLLYINRDAELFGTSGARAGEQIDDNVYACVCNATAAFYMKNYSSQSGVFALYGSDGSLKFKLIAENVSAVI